MPPDDLPPWFRPPHPPPEAGPGAGPASSAVSALARLQAGEVAWIVGPADSGLTTTAARLASATEGPLRAARLTACRTAADLVLVVGEATGAVPPGDEGAVAAALRALGPALVVLDDADLPDRSEALDQLCGLAPEARWLCIGRRAPLGASLLPTPSPPARASGDPAPPAPLSTRGELLALVGVSLPGPHDLPADAALPVGGGRFALRRSVAEALRGRGGLEPARVAAAALPDVEPLLAAATGAPARAGYHVDDALLLRWLGEVLAEPDAACRASAAAARHLSALGQPLPAFEVLDGARRRNGQARPGARALVAWAEAELRQAWGQEAQAEAAWREAGALLEEDRELVLLGVLLRRRADALAARGEARRAADGYRQARGLLLRLEDPAGVAATVRGAADLAVCQGEVLSAGMLYDEAEATAAGLVEATSRALGRAGLALAQGDLGRARQLLAAVEADAEDLPLLDANRRRRLAELALREGQHTVARAQAADAADRYARLGEGVAWGRTVRLQGDVEAAAGDPVQAMACWQRAAHLQLRVRDLVGLRRTLAHAAALEQEAGDPGLAAGLRELVAALVR